MPYIGIKYKKYKTFLLLFIDRRDTKHGSVYRMRKPISHATPSSQTNPKPPQTHNTYYHCGNMLFEITLRDIIIIIIMFVHGDFSDVTKARKEYVFPRSDVCNNNNICVRTVCTLYYTCIHVITHRM